MYQERARPNGNSTYIVDVEELLSTDATDGSDLIFNTRIEVGRKKNGRTQMSAGREVRRLRSAYK